MSRIAVALVGFAALALLTSASAGPLGTFQPQTHYQPSYLTPPPIPGTHLIPPASGVEYKSAGLPGPSAPVSSWAREAIRREVLERQANIAGQPWNVWPLWQWGEYLRGR